MRKQLLVLVVIGALLFGCTSGESSSTDTTGADGGDSTATTEGDVVATGPSPGVTDDSVKIGVTYVDLASLAGIVDIDHGDYEAAYQAQFDAINEAGGINGRTLEPVFAPIAPVGPDPADEACTKLTEDDDVFIAVGFFLDDAVLCPVETHETAVIGGAMTPERLERAAAPWFTNEASTDVQTEGIRAMAEAGALDDNLGVFAGAGQEQLMDDVVLPLLDELGVEVTESAVVDQTAEDITATNAAVAVIAERFESAGVDKVLVLGNSGLAWAIGTEPLDYRPEMRAPDFSALLTFAQDEEAERDLSILDGAVGSGIYGPTSAVYELPGMQECIGVIEDGGVDVPDPADLAPEDQTYISALTSCAQMELLTALLEAAGEDLNYGTLEAGADGLVVDMPNQPEPVTYGPAPAADGDPPVFLFDWSEDDLTFVLQD